jgi:thioredoxin-related protein
MIPDGAGLFKARGEAAERVAVNEVARGPSVSYHSGIRRVRAFRKETGAMKIRHSIVALLVPAALLASCGERGTPEERGEGAAAKAWLPFNEGMTLAARERKPVVIDFYTSWCHWCSVMDRETFSNAAVRKYLAEHFVAIRVDAENRADSLFYKGGTYTPFTLGRRFGVRAFPSLAYLDADQELVTVVPGFVPAKTFLPILQYMQKECYKQRMTFEEYMKRNGDCDSAKTGA